MTSLTLLSSTSRSVSNAQWCCLSTLLHKYLYEKVDDGHLCWLFAVFKRNFNSLTGSGKMQFGRQRLVNTRAAVDRYFDIHTISHRKMSTPQQSKLVPVAESKRFMTDCFLAVNVPKDHAEAMADLLVAADYRGHFSHGMNRLEMYINDLTINSTDGAAIPQILKETLATAWVDGRNGLGVVVGNFCMDLAIKKAKTVGVGWVCAKGSNHYGIASWYVLRALKEGLMGLTATNTSPLMAPTRSKEAALGTNPISFGAPAKEDKFLLDMATTAVAVGKIEIQRRKGEPLPDGWAQDPTGKQTNDPELAFNTGCLMPIGGAEVTSGYKGYGLGAMVDIISGVAAGANYSTKVRKWTHTGANTAADLGQVFIAVDPKCFAPGFEDRMVDFNGRLRGCEPALQVSHGSRGWEDGMA
ncbi:uncharacterized oxidoreductase YjmC isoform X2 [Eurosta solidaginis]|uniref:uncharacterized oxidoreductase YjmC isoform X2 n=1 Tax=Eurosta solidaginis TaxID=178769 RepID=UPI00353176F1